MTSTTARRTFIPAALVLLSLTGALAALHRRALEDAHRETLDAS